MFNSTSTYSLDKLDFFEAEQLFIRKSNGIWTNLFCFILQKHNKFITKQNKMEVLSSISDFIWNDDFWLPEGFTWKDLEITPGGVRKPQFADLYYVPIIALFLVLVRIIFER